MIKRLNLQYLLFLFLIFPLIFFLFQKVSSDLVLAEEVPEEEETYCLEGETEYEVGETIDCNDCGEKTCQESGSWSDCQKKASAGPCCDDDGNHRPPTDICNTETRTQYKCEPNDECANKVLKREQKRYRYCPGNSDLCVGLWSSWETISSSETQCEEWQKCKNGDWATKVLSCQCAGECLEAAENPRLLDEKGEEIPPVNVHLPFALDWDDVEHSQSFILKIEDTTIGTFTKVLTESGYSLFCENREVSPCLLKSDTTHKWAVSPCCNPNGTNCKPWEDVGQWEFTTDLNPAKECLDIPNPESMKIFDGLGELKPEEGKDYPSNVHLPIRFDWDDVALWQEYLGPQSYKIRIENTAKDKEPKFYNKEGDFERAIEQSEYIPSGDTEVGPCLLKSNTRHNWHVKACCTVDGVNCGYENDELMDETLEEPFDEPPIYFSTSLAPEPYMPADPDWNAIEEIATPTWLTPSEEEPYPVHIKWCPVEEAQSYCLRAYYCPRAFKDELPYCEYEIPYCPEFFCPIIITKTTKKPEYLLVPEVDFDLDSFTKETYYKWEVATCLRDKGEKCSFECSDNRICYFDLDDPGCGEYSQKWSFYGEVILPVVQLTSPENEESVNFSHSLEWKHVSGAKSYRYEFDIYPAIPIYDFISIKDLWNQGKLNLNTEYFWRVQPCWEEEGKDCQEESWSEKWKFTTTGAPPKTLDADTTIIPVKLDWEDVPGALSYRYEVTEVSSNRKVAEGLIYSLTGTPPSEISVDYPKLKQERDYSWRVKTCADEEGKVCGAWSDVKEFRTFKLATPINPHPGNNGEFFTYESYVYWGSVLGARFYQYKIDYLALSPEEKNESCSALVGKEVVPPKVVSSNSGLPSLMCLGDYQWQVRACLDKDCNETGDWSNIWNFTLIQKAPPGEKGLVPCGRTYDDPDTPWNEREPCQVKHLFILLRSIIDFLLWRMGLVTLVLLIIATGVIYYFSMGAPATVVDIRAIWKAAGKGYAIIFLAWLIVNFLLALLGYKVQVFGNWWLLPF